MSARKTDKDKAGAVEETPEVLDKEMERMVPGPTDPVTLTDGTKVHIRPMKMRELFAAFKIITRGAAMSMGALSLDTLTADQDAFAETMIALLINAVPEADQEVAEFLRISVDPVAPKDGWDSKEDQIKAEIHLDELLLQNPEIEDFIDVLSTIIYRESRDIERLGKKVSSAVKMFSVTEKKGSKKK